jgi:hypothetical protein
MPVGPPPERISPKVIFCGRMAQDSAAGGDAQIINTLWIGATANYCPALEAPVTPQKLQTLDRQLVVTASLMP